VPGPLGRGGPSTRTRLTTRTLQSSGGARRFGAFGPLYSPFANAPDFGKRLWIVLVVDCGPLDPPHSTPSVDPPLDPPARPPRLTPSLDPARRSTLEASCRRPAGATSRSCPFLGERSRRGMGYRHGRIAEGEVRGTGELRLRIAGSLVAGVCVRVVWPSINGASRGRAPGELCTLTPSLAELTAEACSRGGSPRGGGT
jgi:hypothetical protein